MKATAGEEIGREGARRRGRGCVCVWGGGVEDEDVEGGRAHVAPRTQKEMSAVLRRTQDATNTT